MKNEITLDFSKDEQAIDYTKLVHCIVSWKPRVYKEVIKKFNDEKHFENWYD